MYYQYVFSYFHTNTKERIANLISAGFQSGFSTAFVPAPAKAIVSLQTFSYF